VLVVLQILDSCTSHRDAVVVAEVLVVVIVVVMEVMVV
jgi:hypothetical protein